MKLARILIWGAILAACSNVFGQARFAGIVTEVVDGRTLVVETNGTKLGVRLQYIATPMADQPMHATVRDHLSKLAIGRIVEFKPAQFSGSIYVGKMTIDGVDVSRQLLRDGAAWHEPRQTSGQNSSEAEEYASDQQLAQQEKRGVWSIPDLKTPWQIQAEIDEQYRKNEAARRLSRRTLVGVSQFQTANRTDLPNGPATKAKRSTGTLDGRDAWVSVLSGVDKETPGLQTHRDPAGRFDTLYTSAAFVDLKLDGKSQKLECRALYVTYKQVNGMNRSMYLIGFRAISEDFRFSRQKSALTVMVDNQAIPLGQPRGLLGQTVVGAMELMFYKASKATLKRISKARSVEFRIDGARGDLSEDIKDLFKQLADVTD